MPDLWIPGIPRVTPTGRSPIPLGLQGRGKRLFTWHTFEADYSLSATRGAQVTNRANSTPTFCFNPVSGELVQQLPANVGARTLKANGPAQHTNAYGDVHMQVEVIGYARRPFTLDLTAAGAASLVKLMNFLRSWGIPDQWAWTGMVTPPATYAEANARGNRGQPDRSGHATHSKWWANEHWDCGAIVPPWLIAPPVTVAPSIGTPPRAPAEPEWPTGWVLAAQKMLNALGYTDADGRPLAEDDNLGPATQHATRTYQTDAGLEPDGRPGTATTKSLEDTMTTLNDIKAQNEKILAAIGPDDLGTRSLASWTRAAVNAAEWSGPARTVSRLAPVLAASTDPAVVGAAIADAIREDVIAAIAEAGSSANAAQVADEIGRRLTTQEK